MKKLMIAVAIAAALLSQAHAAGSDAPADPASKPRQQTRMKECNEQARGMKGDERKEFMKDCLSTKKETADAKATTQTDAKGAKDAKDAKDAKETKAAQGGKETQQNRMKTCNAEAKGKTGDERKAFMKECLSKA